MKTQENGAQDPEDGQMTAVRSDIEGGPLPRGRVGDDDGDEDDDGDDDDDDDAVDVVDAAAC